MSRQLKWIRTGCQGKGGNKRGIYKRERKSEGPLIVVTVPSITKTLQKAKKAKGKIVTDKQEAGEWGWWPKSKTRKATRLSYGKKRTICNCGASSYMTLGGKRYNIT